MKNQQTLRVISLFWKTKTIKIEQNISFQETLQRHNILRGNLFGIRNYDNIEQPLTGTDLVQRN